MACETVACETVACETVACETVACETAACEELGQSRGNVLIGNLFLSVPVEPTDRLGPCWLGQGSNIGRAGFGPKEKSLLAGQRALRD